MIPVPRPDLADERWQQWRTAARQATQALVAGHQAGAHLPLQDRLYKEAMPFLLDLFHGKCAYCETVISSNQPGDVEHYRPKGRIRDEQGAVVKLRVGGAEIEHPGYWWLAYDWRNLLPSCIDCNRRRRHGPDDTLAGKAEYFAVRGPRAASPDDDLGQEAPLLLDPADAQFDPRKHFEFLDNGKMRPLTDEAAYTCELLGLNLREGLVAQRACAYLEARNALIVLLTQAACMSRVHLAMVREHINDMWQGRSPYSGFARGALVAVRDQVFQNTGAWLPLPVP